MPRSAGKRIYTGPKPLGETCEACGSQNTRVLGGAGKGWRKATCLDCRHRTLVQVGGAA